MANKDKKRQSGSAVAEPEAQSETEASGEAVIEADQESTPGRRLPHVPAEQFAALRDELGMSNKQVAEAIGRTLARVSELTYSQGASIQTWERFEKDVRAWREEHPAGSNEDESTADES